MSRIPIIHYMQPGGYHFVDTSSGTPVRIEGESYDDVASRVLKYRIANGYPPGNPIEELYAYACNAAPFICKGTEPQSPVPRQVTNSLASIANRVAAWFSAFYRSGAASDRGIPFPDTERRANACADCPHNKAIEGCSSCVDGINRLFFVWRRDRPIHRERELGGCNLLGQHNGVGVLANTLPPVPDDLKAKLPPRCWRK